VAVEVRVGSSEAEPVVVELGSGSSEVEDLVYLVVVVALGSGFIVED
jgi:hypothetical protein